MLLFEKLSGEWPQVQRLLSSQTQGDAPFRDPLPFTENDFPIVNATRDSNDFIFDGAV